MNYLMLRTKGRPAWNPVFFDRVLDEGSCKIELKTDEGFSHTFPLPIENALELKKKR